MNRKQRRAAAHSGHSSRSTPDALDRALDRARAREVIAAIEELMGNGAPTGTGSNGWHVLDYSARRIIATRGPHTVSIELADEPTPDGYRAIDGLHDVAA